MNNKTLLIVFSALLLTYLISRIACTQKTATFDPQLMQLDTALIDQIQFSSKVSAYENITIQKSNGSWSVTCPNVEDKANQNLVTGLLTALADVKALRIAAKSKDKYQDFELGDSVNSHLKIMSNGKVLKELYVGSFSFNPQTRSGISYVRIKGDDRVYAVEGFLSLSTNVDCSGLRDDLFFSCDPQNIGKIVLNSETTLQEIVLQDNMWKIKSKTIDSITMQQYLNVLQNLSCRTFAKHTAVDDVNKFASVSVFDKSNAEIGYLLFYLSNEDPKNPFVITSSMRKNANAVSDSSGLFKQLITDFPSSKFPHAVK